MGNETGGNTESIRQKTKNPVWGREEKGEKRESAPPIAPDYFKQLKNPD